MAKRITLKDRMDYDGYDVDIDGTVQFSITWDQAKRLHEALTARQANSRDPVKACRKAWQTIARQGYRNSIGHGGALGFMQSIDGDSVLVVHATKTVRMDFSPKDYVEHLLLADRPRAIQFLRENGVSEKELP